MTPDGVAGVIMGNVLPAGLGQAPARQAAIGAGIPVSAPAVTVNKMCGSGMQALIQGHDLLAAGGAGADRGRRDGEHEQRALPAAQDARRREVRPSQVLDHMAMDGLEDAYNPGRAMGTYADETARVMGISRADQDAFAERSLRLAQDAGSNAGLRDEIADVRCPAARATSPSPPTSSRAAADAAKIPTLRPAFGKDGTVTAANASSISDGAAALVMATWRRRRTAASRRWPA